MRELFEKMIDESMAAQRADIDTIKKKRVSAKGSFNDVNNRGTNKGLISLDGETDSIAVIGREATINYTDDE